MNKRSTLLSIGVSCTALFAFAGSQAVGQAEAVGPAPTEASVSAGRGPFAFANTVVPRQNNFGGGTIWYPTDTSQKYGVIAVVPGFVSAQSSIQWYGPRLASNGFVVITIDTLGGFDLPGNRSDQLVAALKHTIAHPAVAAKIDTARQGVIGWSMGGGGALQTPQRHSPVKAIVALAPWDWWTTTGSLKVPSLIVSCQNDAIAGNGNHSTPFYNGIPAGTPKANLTKNGGDHFCVTLENGTIGKFVVSWMKRYMDGDTRYTQFLCPPAAPSGFTYKSTCPL